MLKLEDLELPEGFGYWLAGLMDGDGNIDISARERIVNHENGKRYVSHECQTRITIGLRDDDAHVIKYIRDTLRCGTVTNKYKTDPRLLDLDRNRRQLINWRVCRADHLKFIVIPLFTECPLHTKKARELELLREAVSIKYDGMLSRALKGTRTTRLLDDNDWNRLKELSDEIREIRRYKKPIRTTRFRGDSHDGRA